MASIAVICGSESTRTKTESTTVHAPTSKVAKYHVEMPGLTDTFSASICVSESSGRPSKPRAARTRHSFNHSTVTNTEVNGIGQNIHIGWQYGDGC